MKKVIVLSLGGSLILPKKTNTRFLIAFVKTLRKYYKTHKFVIVCGGGSIARAYIQALRAEKKSEEVLARAGIMATRMNARFLMQLFGKEANDTLPLTIEHIVNSLEKNNVVICGALRYIPHTTSDSTAARIAHVLKTDFINFTDVEGLFEQDPKKTKHAKRIPSISWSAFEKKASKHDFKAGQNFVIDATTAQIIKKRKIKTFIIGNLSSFKNIIQNKPIKGTIVYG